MKDISRIMQEAIEQSDAYNSDVVSSKLEENCKVWCRLEDDSNMNWYLISETDGKSVKSYLGYLSRKYPIAILYDSCPQAINEFLHDENVFTEEYKDEYSCKESVLRHYIDNVTMIDDRFLYDDSLPFDYEKFKKIDEGIHYINPCRFSIDAIK